MDFDFNIICSYNNNSFEEYIDSNIESLKKDIMKELSLIDSIHLIDSELVHAIYQLKENKEYELSFCKYRLKE